MKVTSLDDVIVAVVAALSAANLGYPVFDGPPDKRPARTVTKYVCIGLEDLPAEDAEVNTADMSQVWKGLGQKSRDEVIHIECVAVGKDTTAANARSQAVSVIQNVSDNLTALKTNLNTQETYGALVSDVKAAKIRATTGGTVSVIQFTIEANARLT